MATSLFVNTVHVCFEYVLAMDNAGMVAMFEYLVDTGLKGFLGCPAVIHEADLLDFFENGSVRDGLVVSDSSMHFDDLDIADTSFSLPPTATDIIESLAKLLTSIDQVRSEQFRRKEDANNLKDLLLVHLRDLEKRISARFDEQDRVHSVRVDAQLANLWRRKIISVFLPNSVSSLIISEAVMPKRGKVVAAAPNHLMTIKADPAGEVVAVAIELGKVVADVEVKAEVIGVDLRREDITAVVVDRSEDRLKID
ncbi:clathrin assembly protein [Dorcoceras hygrometricum]|uniref:Clathrin assembly protein n=1 Tax=Dorcoceras hygrometricum TaxID=472368 RepID=A0A2Z7ABA4_9LAMI|nr:clathrin assembly protein [Dorcoceras hygrometricum]